MISRLAGLATFFSSITACVFAAPATPLENGEHLAYKVSWAIVPGAGEIKIDASTDTSGPETRLKVVTTTSTRRLARVLLPFDASAESIYDFGTGKLLSLHEKSLKSDRKNEHQVAFDYVRKKATYTDPTNPEPRALDIPDGDPQDLIMALLQTRTWDLKPGEARDALVLFDDDFYQLTIHAVRYEDILTAKGRYHTLQLEPRMEKTAPKGMFRRGSTVRVWISQDAHRLPVKFEVEFKIGTGTATLDTYRPPLIEPAAGGSTGVVNAKNSSP